MSNKTLPRALTLAKPPPCPACDGRKELEVSHGTVTVHIVCPTCRGKGVTIRQEALPHD